MATPPFLAYGLGARGQAPLRVTTGVNSDIVTVMKRRLKRIASLRKEQEVLDLYHDYEIWRESQRAIALEAQQAIQPTPPPSSPIQEGWRSIPDRLRSPQYIRPTDAPPRTLEEIKEEFKPPVRILDGEVYPRRYEDLQPAPDRSLWDITKRVGATALSPAQVYDRELLDRIAAAATVSGPMPIPPPIGGFVNLRTGLGSSMTAGDLNLSQLPGVPGWRESYEENVPVHERFITKFGLDPLLYGPGRVSKVAKGAKGAVGAAARRLKPGPPRGPQRHPAPDIPAVTERLQVYTDAEIDALERAAAKVYTGTEIEVLGRAAPSRPPSPLQITEGGSGRPLSTRIADLADAESRAPLLEDINEKTALWMQTPQGKRYSELQTETGSFQRFSSEDVRVEYEKLDKLYRESSMAPKERAASRKDDVPAVEPDDFDMDDALETAKASRIAESSKIAKKWQSAKSRNSVRAAKDLQGLKAKGHDTSGAEDALEDYKYLEKSDFDTAEDFSEARSEAWDDFVNTLDDLVDAVDDLEVDDLEIGEELVGIAEGAVPGSPLTRDLQKYVASLARPITAPGTSVQQPVSAEGGLAALAKIGGVGHYVGPRRIENDLLEDAIQKQIDEGAVNDFYYAASNAVKKMGDDAGLPPGPPPPPLAAHFGAAGNDPPGAFTEMIHGIPGEDAGRAAVRKWLGAIKAAGTEAESHWLHGQELMRQAGLGKRLGSGQVLTRAEGEPLQRALHGLGPVPEGQRALYDDLVRLRNLEERATLNDDPTRLEAFLEHPDYLPQIWKSPPGEAERLSAGGIGAKPWYMKQRTWTFDEALEEGAEPKSWNPYDLVSFRRLAGEEFRANKQLVQRLKAWDMAIPENVINEFVAGLPEDAPNPYRGWRVPDVGPAFTGKHYIRSDGKIGRTEPIMVPARVANSIEDMFPLKRGTVGETGLAAIQRVTQGAKRMKLFGSLFQHVDFLTRAGGVAFSPTGIRSGAPLKYPSFVARVMNTSLRQAPRTRLTAKLLSNDPLYRDFAISHRMVMEEGGQFGVDTTMFRRHLRDFLDQAGQDAPQGMGGLVRKRIDQANKFFESGLFQGVYRESQIFGLENLIIPKLRRMHPKWSPREIAAAAAEEMNKMFSTLASWQMVLNSPNQQFLARSVFFSAGESEGWIRQALSTILPRRAHIGNVRIVNENGALWREHALGMMIFLSIVGNLINVASTGKPMPLKSYLPITTDSPYAFLPGGIGYNDRFLSPELPFVGRGGVPLFLDIVGQADTFFRWVLDPPGALSARYNLLPRAVINQARGNDFYGRPLEGLVDRVRQAADDLFMPIGLGNVGQVARHLSQKAAEVIRASEDRLGVGGSILQSFGLNVGSETTPQMLDRYAVRCDVRQRDPDTGTMTGPMVTKWEQLEPRQRDECHDRFPELGIELTKRQDVAALRQSESAKTRQELDDIDETRLATEKALIHKKQIGTATGQQFRNKVNEIQADAAKRRSVLFKDGAERPDDPLRAALYDYYQTFQTATDDAGMFEFDLHEELLDDLEQSWTKGQVAYVQENINRTKHPPMIDRYLKDRRTFKYYFEVDKYVLGFDREQLGLRRRYVKLGAVEKQVWDISFPQLREAEQAISSIRKKLRETDPELRLFLFEFYDGSLPAEELLPGRVQDMAPWRLPW